MNQPRLPPPPSPGSIFSEDDGVGGGGGGNITICPSGTYSHANTLSTNSQLAFSHSDRDGIDPSVGRWHGDPSVTSNSSYSVSTSGFSGTDSASTYSYIRSILGGDSGTRATDKTDEDDDSYVGGREGGGGGGGNYNLLSNAVPRPFSSAGWSVDGGGGEEADAKRDDGGGFGGSSSVSLLASIGTTLLRTVNEEEMSVSDASSFPTQSSLLTETRDGDDGGGGRRGRHLRRTSSRGNNDRRGDDRHRHSHSDNHHSSTRRSSRRERQRRKYYRDVVRMVVAVFLMGVASNWTANKILKTAGQYRNDSYASVREANDARTWGEMLGASDGGRVGDVSIPKSSAVPEEGGWVKSLRDLEDSSSTGAIPVAQPLESLASDGPLTDRFQKFRRRLLGLYKEVVPPEDGANGGGFIFQHMWAHPLYRTDSPQYHALDWIADEDELELSDDSPGLVQRYVLAVLYFSTGGRISSLFHADGGRNDHDSNGFSQRGSGGWRHPTKFLTPEHECSWKGAIASGGRGGGIRRCDRDKNVLEISIYNDLVGTLPSELGRLWSLEVLYLGRNHIGGTVPSEFGSLTRLNTLSLQHNQLTGTLPQESWKGLTALRTLQIEGNPAIGGHIHSHGPLCRMRADSHQPNQQLTQLQQLNAIAHGFDDEGEHGGMDGSVLDQDNNGDVREAMNQLINSQGKLRRLTADCVKSGSSSSKVRFRGMNRKESSGLECGCCTECMG